MIEVRIRIKDSDRFKVPSECEKRKLRFAVALNILLNQEKDCCMMIMSTFFVREFKIPIILMFNLIK